MLEEGSVDGYTREKGQSCKTALQGLDYLWFGNSGDGAGITLLKTLIPLSSHTIMPGKVARGFEDK